MWQQVELALSQSAHRVLVKLAIFLPALVALLLAVIILTAIGAGLAALLRRFLTAAKFDERLARNTIAPISDWSPANSPTALIARVVFWGCVLVGCFIGISAADAAYPGDSQLSAYIIPYIARSVGAILLLIAGTLIARFLERSVLIGAVTVGPVLFGDYFGSSIFVLTGNNVVGTLAADFGGPVRFALHGLAALPFWFALAGAVTAWACFLWRPGLADAAVRIRTFGWLYRTLTHKYYFDWFNEQVLAALTRLIGVGLWKGGDEALIDGAMVNGSAATVGWVGSLLRRVQSGYLYSYAFWMMIGLALLVGWFLAHTRY